MSVRDGAYTSRERTLRMLEFIQNADKPSAGAVCTFMRLTFGLRRETVQTRYINEMVQAGVLSIDSYGRCSLKVTLAKVYGMIAAASEETKMEPMEAWK